MRGMWGELWRKDVRPLLSRFQSVAPLKSANFDTLESIARYKDLFTKQHCYQYTHLLISLACYEFLRKKIIRNFFTNFFFYFFLTVS